MARPKKENHPISIRMDKTIYDRLNEFCEASGQPKTVAIERAISEYTTPKNTNIEEQLIALRQTVPDLFGSYCIVNGAIMRLEEIQKMGFNEYAFRSKINMPTKLYKFFPNTIKNIEGTDRNVSMEALENNTVYMQSPSEFDDAFDSDIVIDYVEYERLRLLEYCQRCGIHFREKASTQENGNALLIKLRDVFLETKDFINAFIEDDHSEMKSLSNQAFCLALKNQILKGVEYGQALANVIHDDYIDYCKNIKETFRISCFTTFPFSQLMWAAYADCHRGFCLEYTVLPGVAQYEDVYLNLYPMIYCKTRPNITERLVKFQDEKPTDEHLWDLFCHGVLRKSFDWAYQNEWRLLFPYSTTKKEDYNRKFFPITKVYLGNKMDAKKRKEIIELCRRKNIPYVGVTRNPNYYEMEECQVLCEKCDRCKTHDADGGKPK